MNPKRHFSGRPEAENLSASRSAMVPRFFSLLAFVTFGTGISLSAQMLGPQPVVVPSAAPAQNPAEAAAIGSGAVAFFTAEQLDQLLGPIALYPDALIALILPAATQSSDVVLAARYLSNGEGAAQIDDQPWDDSVKALAHYPEVVKWMDQNLAWTKQLGDAFVAQPAEVMKSVQRLRAAARAAGTLVDTPQQQVVNDADAISIVPTEPGTIYVPYYDAQQVYLPRRGYGYYPGSFFSFGIGYPSGFWLGYNMDWRQRRILVIDRHERERFWHEQRDWRRPSFDLGVAWTSKSFVHPWQPAPAVVHVQGYNRPESRRSAPGLVQPPSTSGLPIDRSLAEWSNPGRTDHSGRGDWDGRDSRANRPDRTPSNRPPQPTPTPNVASSAPLPAVVANNFQPIPGSPPVQAQVSPPAPAPTAPAGSSSASVYSRGNRSAPSDDQNSHSGRSHDRPADGASSGSRAAPPASGQTAPVRSSAPAPAQAPAQTPIPAPNADGSQPVSRSHRERHSEPVASSNSSNSSASTSAPTEEYSRGRRAGGIRRE
jgi:hypothetical protein